MVRSLSDSQAQCKQSISDSSHWRTFPLLTDQTAMRLSGSHSDIAYPSPRLAASYVRQSGIKTSRAMLSGLLTYRDRVFELHDSPGIRRQRSRVVMLLVRSAHPTQLQSYEALDGSLRVCSPSLLHHIDDCYMCRLQVAREIL